MTGPADQPRHPRLRRGLLASAAGDTGGGEEAYADALASLEADLPAFNEHVVALGGMAVELRYPDKPSFRCIFGLWDMADALGTSSQQDPVAR